MSNLGNKKIKLVVINNCMLGYILPGTPNSAGILAASVIRGAVCASQAIEPKAVHPSEYRLATENDFDEFRVSFKGFDNAKEYEYQE